jgi:isoprenylcysteine carboxyl methyltransferase (ICMT) family protein YpbQ
LLGNLGRSVEVSSQCRSTRWVCRLGSAHYGRLKRVPLVLTHYRPFMTRTMSVAVTNAVVAALGSNSQFDVNVAQARASLFTSASSTTTLGSLLGL